MGYPNNNCMVITVHVHHMQIDELFDFLNDRIEETPPYWFSESEAPYSVTGGYVAVTINYEQFCKIRQSHTWDDQTGTSF